MYNQVQFIISVAKTKALPADKGIEVAFAGRSNAGKSSAINTLTGISRLAKTSKMPGRTQLINYFSLGDKAHLVDLPGYGYAKVPSTIKAQIENLLGDYLQNRQSLRGLILLMDIRHPLTPYDRQLLELTLERNLPVHILLTKSDKLGRGAAKNVLLEVQKELKGLSSLLSVQLFSSLKKTGVDELKACIDGWCGF